MFNTGKVNLTRRVAIAGSMVKQTGYVDALVGTPLKQILADNIADGCNVRILNGNPLTGVIANEESVLGAHTSEVTLIPEGDDVHEIFGWMLPRFKTSLLLAATSLGCRARRRIISMHVSRVESVT